MRIEWSYPLGILFHSRCSKVNIYSANLKLCSANLKFCQKYQHRVFSELFSIFLFYSHVVDFISLVLLLQDFLLGCFVAQAVLLSCFCIRAFSLKIQCIKSFICNSFLRNESLIEMRRILPANSVFHILFDSRLLRCIERKSSN